MFAHAAHGEFPMPLWLFVYAVVAAVLIAVVALRMLWPSPRLDALSQGVAVPSWVDSAAVWIGRAFGVFVFSTFVVVLAAAWFGESSTAINLAPTALYVAFWVGIPILSVFLGDVWERANPLAVVARALDRIAGRGESSPSLDGFWSSHWLAAVGLFAFVWTELAYHEPYSVGATGTFLGVYVAVMLVGAGFLGSSWLRTADGFAVLFSLFASLAPLRRVEGAWRWRWPGAGIAEIETRDGTLAVLAVVIGAVGFDGVARSQLWLDIIGGRSPWDQTLVSTLGLLLCVAVVLAVFTLITRLAARLGGDDDVVSKDVTDRWVPILVPVAFGLFVAHSFALLVIDGQAFWSLLSDPFGWGWDLFGTADALIDPELVSAHTIAWVQVLGIATGHVADVVAVHDMAVARYEAGPASSVQVVFVGSVVATAVGGLLLLL